LMNICMATAVNPATGKIAVVGTEAMNHIRFEPQLKSIFLRVNIALVDPMTLGKTIRDLNPHLDYSVRSVPQAVRDQSLGDPRGIVWDAAGTRGYVTGLGSNNLVVIDGDGQRVQAAPIELGEGPTGLVLDEPRQRLYIYNRFGGGLSVVDTTSLAVVATLPFSDPTPEFIRSGRRLFFDTRHTSGLGHVSCASCHVDVRFDRLAWDLGIPNGEMESTGAVEGGALPLAHPMKGPMVTLTLQGFTGAGAPFHWRGDRNSLAAFDVTFADLLGMDRMPTRTEMNKLLRYLTAVTFPPNPYRTLENLLSEFVPLPGHFAPDGTPLPAGNAVNALLVFRQTNLNLAPPLTFGNNCGTCHDFGSGRGHDFKSFPFPRNNDVIFRSPPLRSVGEKIGFALSAPESRAGFGFFHDGRADTLSHLLATGFNVTAPQDMAILSPCYLAYRAAACRPAPMAGMLLRMPLRRWENRSSPQTPTSRRFSPHCFHSAKTEITRPTISSSSPGSVAARSSAPGSTILWRSASWNPSGSRQLHHLSTPRARLARHPIVFLAVSAGTGRQQSIDFDGDGVGNLGRNCPRLRSSQPCLAPTPAHRRKSAPFPSVNAHPGSLR
jgi:hypothetical protein